MADDDLTLYGDVYADTYDPPDTLDTLDPPGALTAEEAADIRRRFDTGEGCRHCGGIHARACPRVRRLVFHPDGGLAEVEFWPAGRWDDTHILWPEEVVVPDGPGTGNPF